MKKLFLALTIVIMVISCTEPEYPIVEIEPDVISYSSNFIKLQSDNIVVLDSGIGHMDKWKIKEGVTFEIIVHESEDWFRFWNTPDFTVSSDRIYCVGEGRDMVTDFNALYPDVMMYYFSIEVIINGDSNTVDYVIDSN